jgi:hypothetical protein
MRVVPPAGTDGRFRDAAGSRRLSAAVPGWVRKGRRPAPAASGLREALTQRSPADTD